MKAEPEVTASGAPLNVLSQVLTCIMVWTRIRRSIAPLLALVLLANFITQGGPAACPAAPSSTAQPELSEPVNCDHCAKECGALRVCPTSCVSFLHIRLQTVETNLVVSRFAYPLLLTWGIGLKTRPDPFPPKSA